jgi:dTDP-4-dehydrorhamnose reductase
MFNDDRELSVAIFGASGKLGTALKEKLPENIVFGKNHDTLDITDHAAVSLFIKTVRPKFLVNCAATSNHRDGGLSYEDHQRVNNIAVSHMAKACAINNVHLIHISDSDVFGGIGKRAYVEFDAICPWSKYAQSKALGEYAIASVGHFSHDVTAEFKFWIIRTSMLLGISGRNNFVDDFVSAAISSRIPLQVTDGVVRSVTYVPHLVKQICWLMTYYRSVPRGIYHIANKGYVSINEMTAYLLRCITDIKHTAPIQVVDHREFTTKYPQLSCRNGALNCELWNSLCEEEMPHWTEAVKDYARCHMLSRSS